MIKVLRIGDMHCQVSNLEESERILEFAHKIVLENKVNRIEFLGDQFHNHEILRLEVVEFWHKWVNILSEVTQVLFLVGNHDICGDKEKEQLMNANNIFSNKVIIINQPKVLDNMLYLPYVSNTNKFIDWCNLYDLKTVICHQTFNGAAYDNGFYAPNGIDLEQISNRQIISGHIHTTQKFGNIFYPGAPRWFNKGDANVEKFIDLYTHDDNGDMIYTERINMKDVCKQIKKYIIKEGDNLPEIDSNCKNYFELTGTSTWINSTKKKLSGLGSIKCITINSNLEVVNKKKNSNLESFLDSTFVPCSGITKEEIKQYLEDLK